MRAGTIANTSLECTWEFGEILLLLPDSGTPEFATLCRALRPYGVSALDILYDKPTDKLADDFLRVSFHDEDVILSLSYDEFVVSANDLSLADESELVDIVQAFFTALQEVGAEPSIREGSLEWTADLILAQSEAESILREHSSVRQSVPELVFDGVVYLIKQGSWSGVREPRISLARSVEAASALTVQYTANYGGDRLPSEILKRLPRDRERALALLGLETLETKKTEE
jgi:hypothetical protein